MITLLPLAIALLLLGACGTMEPSSDPTAIQEAPAPSTRGDVGGPVLNGLF